MAERTWRSGDQIAAAVRLSRAGMGARGVSEATGISVATIRTWRRGRIPLRARLVLENVPVCARCGGVAHEWSALPASAYAYLLGLYLGDGCLTRHTGLSCALRIFLDAAYPGIVDSARDAIAAVKGGAIPGASLRRDCRCVVVTSYWTAWRCLLPQHGPGRKHERPIVLTPWQRDIVGRAPEAFLRALIHTDGWRGANRVRVKGRDYAYPRYQFSNRSAEIRRLFTDACDELGVAWRPWGRWHISVARREAVATLDRFIGPKA